MVEQALLIVLVPVVGNGGVPPLQLGEGVTLGVLVVS